MQSTTSSTPSRGLWLLLCIVLTITLLWLAWVGFVNSDDAEYLDAGQALAKSGWNAPAAFGGMRLAISAPIGIATRMLGQSEFSLVLPTLLYALGTAIVTLLSLGRYMSQRRALTTTLLFMSLPVVATTSTIASADIAEMFWAVCAFWLAVETPARPLNQQRLMIGGIGVLLALAFSARETSIALALWISAGFLFGYGVPRLRYLWAGVTFILAMALECTYFAIASGDPFARFRALVATRSATFRVAVQPFTFDDTGNLRIHDSIDPIVMLLTKHSFGATYWLLLSVFIVAMVRGKSRPRQAMVSPIAPAILLGLIWMLFASLVLSKLRIHARYYIVPTYFLIVAAILWLQQQDFSRSARRWVVCGICLLALTNAVGLWVENKNPRFAERVLAEFSRQQTRPIHTDTRTAAAAIQFARWIGADPSLIVSTRPEAGDLAFRLDTGLSAQLNKFSDGSVAEIHGVVLQRMESPALIPGSLGTALAASNALPGPVIRKLTGSRSSAELVRVEAPSLSGGQVPLPKQPSSSAP